MEILNVRSAVNAIALAVLVYLVRKVYGFYLLRKQFRNLPGPPHSWIFGHLIPMAKVAMKVPIRVHPHSIMCYLREEYDLPSVFYIDCFPVNDPMLVILDPQIAQEVTTVAHLHKSVTLSPVVTPVSGRENLLTMEGSMWKKWRGIFNPAFSNVQLMSQVPIMVECVQKFADLVGSHADKNDVFLMEEEATKLTLDVIGRAVLDYDFQALTGKCEFLTILRKTLSWFPNVQSINPFHRRHPIRPWAQQYYKRRMDDCIGKILDEKFSSRQLAHGSSSKKKSGIDLALEAYYKDSGKKSDSNVLAMDPEFRRMAIVNFLILIFAGHDTTASTICYIYHLLAKHPDKLAKVRSELDDVFGKNGNATEQLKENPYIINTLEYTQAVIREVLRLWPPASTVRQGRPDYFIRDPSTGQMLPTDNLLVWIPSIVIHRWPKLWGEDVSEFRPERFLPENSHNLPADAWRPFEKGPRNCIGQELAMIELKLTVAMTIREFDVVARFDELHKLDRDVMWAAQTESRGPQEVFGDEMYQILVVAGKPRDGMPARAARSKY